MGFGDSHVRQEMGHHPGRHGTASVCTNRQLIRFDALFAANGFDEPFCQGSGFTMGNHPVDCIPTEDVHDDVEVIVYPFVRPFELSDIPGPYMVRADGQQFQPWMSQLVSSFSNFSMPGQDSTYCPEGTQIVAFIEQGGEASWGDLSTK